MSFVLRLYEIVWNCEHFSVSKILQAKRICALCVFDVAIMDELQQVSRLWDGF